MISVAPSHTEVEFDTLEHHGRGLSRPGSMIVMDASGGNNGVQGDSSYDDGDWIDLTSVTYGIGSLWRGAYEHIESHHDVVVTKGADSASTILMERLKQKSVIESIVIRIIDTRTDLPLVEIVLFNVMVTHFAPLGAAGEVFALKYQSVQYTYDPSGSPVLHTLNVQSPQA